MSVVDVATWETLGSHRAPFAQGACGARCYLADVSPLCAVRDTVDPVCWTDLTDLMGERERIGVLLW